MVGPVDDHQHLPVAAPVARRRVPAETGTLPRASTAAAPPASLMPGVISRRAKPQPP